MVGLIPCFEIIKTKAVFLYKSVFTVNQVCCGVNFKGILHLNNEKKKPYTEFTVKLVYYRFHGKGN